MVSKRTDELPAPPPPPFWRECHDSINSNPFRGKRTELEKWILGLQVVLVLVYSVILVTGIWILYVFISK